MIGCQLGLLLISKIVLNEQKNVMGSVAFFCLSADEISFDSDVSKISIAPTEGFFGFQTFSPTPPEIPVL